MPHICDAFVYYTTISNGRSVVFSDTQDINNWNIGNSMAKYNYKGELNFRVEDVENGFILSLGAGYNNGGASSRFVFNTIQELNDFISKTNAEELS